MNAIKKTAAVLLSTAYVTLKLASILPAHAEIHDPLDGFHGIRTLPHETGPVKGRPTDGSLPGLSNQLEASIVANQPSQKGLVQ